MMRLSNSYAHKNQRIGRVIERERVRRIAGIADGSLTVEQLHDVIDSSREEELDDICDHELTLLEDDLTEGGF